MSVQLEPGETKLAEALASDRAEVAIGRRCVLAAAVLWSLSGVFTKGLALDGVTIAFYRGLFAGLALVPAVPRAGKLSRSMLPLGLCFGVMTGLYIAALKRTTAANAIFLQCTSTFWTIPSRWLCASGPIVGRSWGSPWRWSASRVIVLFGYDGRPGEKPGVALALASGFAYACVATGLRGFRAIDPIWLSAINNLMGSLALGLYIIASTETTRRTDAGRGWHPVRLRRPPDGDPVRALRPRPAVTRRSRGVAARPARASSQPALGLPRPWRAARPRDVRGRTDPARGSGIPIFGTSVFASLGIGGDGFTRQRITLAAGKKGANRSGSGPLPRRIPHQNPHPRRRPWQPRRVSPDTGPRGGRHPGRTADPGPSGRSVNPRQGV